MPDQPGERRHSGSVELSVISYVDRAIEQSEKLGQAERERLREVIEERLKGMEEARKLALDAVQTNTRTWIAILGLLLGLAIAAMRFIR